ncbi:MAG: hypothetical protein ACJ77K_10595 [Bacteroidia bacterium]
MAYQPVPTWYGTFTPIYYEPVHIKGGRSVGVNMYMEFKPNERVIDAKKIGFVQVAKVLKDNKPDQAEKHQKRITVKKNVGKDYYLDQYSGFQNPLYPTGKEKSPSVKNAKNKLGGYEADKHPEPVDYSNKGELLDLQTDEETLVDRKWANFGEFGHRYLKPNSDVQLPPNTPNPNTSMFEEKDASFQDCPYKEEIVDGSCEEFETTALVADGKQKGLYLGSVTWGWSRTGVDETGFKQSPFLIKSEGAPSETFFKSAELWNHSRTSGLRRTVDLPMSEGTVVKDQLKFYKKDNVADVDPITPDKQLAKGTHCRMIGEAKGYLRIRVLDAAETYEEGFVPMIEDANPTVDKMNSLPNWPKPQVPKKK